MERSIMSLHVAFAAALGLAAVSAHADIYAPAAQAAAERSVGTLAGDTAFSYSTADTTDRAVAERVMDALAQDPALQGSAITVLVDEGHVRLSGATRDEEQAAHALEVARDAAGPDVVVGAGDLEPDGTAAAIR